MKAAQPLPGDRDEGGSDGERDTKVCKVDFEGDRYLITLLILKVVSWGSSYARSYEIVRVKYVPFTVWQLHLNQVDKKIKQKKKCYTLLY